MSKRLAQASLDFFLKPAQRPRIDSQAVEEANLCDESADLTYSSPSTSSGLQVDSGPVPAVPAAVPAVPAPVPAVPVPAVPAPDSVPVQGLPIHNRDIGQFMTNQPANDEEY